MCIADRETRLGSIFFFEGITDRLEITPNPASGPSTAHPRSHLRIAIFIFILTTDKLYRPGTPCAQCGGFGALGSSSFDFGLNSGERLEHRGQPVGKSGRGEAEHPGLAVGG